VLDSAHHAVAQPQKKLQASPNQGAAPPRATSSPAYLHDRCKYVADLAGLNKEEWHRHRFRDTAATRWLRAGIDVRTVQSWLGHESLATTQKYLEPSRDTEKALSKMRLPF
jgi:site-specific recombinase XerD